jgi:hypothetical protein
MEFSFKNFSGIRNGHYIDNTMIEKMIYCYLVRAEIQGEVPYLEQKQRYK